MGRQTLKANRHAGSASVALGLCFLALIGNARAEPVHLDEIQGRGRGFHHRPIVRDPRFFEWRVPTAARHRARGRSTCRLREPAAEGAPASSLELVLDVAAVRAKAMRATSSSRFVRIEASPSSARSLSAISRRWLERVLSRWRQPSSSANRPASGRRPPLSARRSTWSRSRRSRPRTLKTRTLRKRPNRSTPPLTVSPQLHLRYRPRRGRSRARPVVALLYVFPNVPFRRSTERHTPTCAGQSPTAGGRRRRVGNGQRSSWHREPLDSFRWPRCHFCDDEQSRRLRRTARRDRLCARQRYRKRNGDQTGSRWPSDCRALSGGRAAGDARRTVVSLSRARSGGGALRTGCSCR